MIVFVSSRYNHHNDIALGMALACHLKNPELCLHTDNHDLIQPEISRMFFRQAKEITGNPLTYVQANNKDSVFLFNDLSNIFNAWKPMSKAIDVWLNLFCTARHFNAHYIFIGYRDDVFPSVLAHETHRIVGGHCSNDTIHLRIDDFTLNMPTQEWTMACHIGHPL